MNIQDMLSKMDPKKLEEGLKSMSGMLSPEQMKQAQAAISNLKGDDMKGVDMNKVQSEIKNNPDIMKQLNNPELMKKVKEIFK